MGWTRRELFRLGVLGWSLAAAPMASGVSRAFAKSARPSAARPRHTVLINMTGGFDSVYTTDPKTRSMVEPWVDVPYGSDEQISVGNMSMGPHLAPLAKQGRMAILNGVQLGTANHDTGLDQFVRLRTGVKSSMPLLLDLLGEHRSGQPLSTVTLGSASMEYYSANWFGLLGGTIPKGEESYPNTDIFAAIEASKKDEDLERLARVIRKHASALRSKRGAAAKTSARNLEQVSSLLEHFPSLTPFKPSIWSKDDDAQGIADQLQRVLWVLGNDLASGVQVGIGQQWDTHWANHDIQTASNQAFMPMLARFLDELRSRELFDNTLVVVGSEIGRFPRLNSNRGKDHLSQVPFLFFGAGVHGGTNNAGIHGLTGRRMEGLPISSRGRVDNSGRVPTLDDVGATVLHMAGIDPSLYGYDGKPLAFLFEDVR